MSQERPSGSPHNTDEKSRKTTSVKTGRSRSKSTSPFIDKAFSNVGPSIYAKFMTPSNALLWSEMDKTTEVAPMVLQRMARAKMMYSQGMKLIEKIKCGAQPNEAYRRERLVPSDVGALGEREELAVSVRDARVMYDKAQPLEGYCNEVADAHHKIGQLHEIFLRQVMKYSVKPLEEYIVCAHPQLLHAYDEMIRCRDRYDAARSKAGNPKTEEKREILRQRATILESFLDNQAAHQMSFAKAIDSYARAEAHYFRQTNKIWRRIRPPGHKKRWAA